MSNIITNTEFREITNPKLRLVLLRVAREIELTIEKVAANHAKPTEFPLPADPKTMESLLAARFKTLPQTIKDNAGNTAIARLRATPEVRRQRFNDLAAINLQSATSIESQVKALPHPANLKFTLDDLPELKTSRLTSAAAGWKKLELRLHKVRCVDETGGWIGENAGDDEIDLGGNTVDETGDVHTIPKFRVRSDFDDGEQQVYSPPKQFAMFNLTEGTEYPKSYFATFVLAEADMGGLPDFLSKLQEKVKEKVTAALIAAFGSLGASGGPVGAVIGMAVGYIVGRVFDWFRSVWEDDIFSPVTVSMKLPSPTATWPNGKTDSPEAIATFRGHDGWYEITYDWRVSQ